MFKTQSGIGIGRLQAKIQTQNRRAVRLIVMTRFHIFITKQYVVL